MEHFGEFAKLKSCASESLGIVEINTLVYFYSSALKSHKKYSFIADSGTTEWERERERERERGERIGMIGSRYLKVTKVKTKIKTW